jgi:hypothetical protein
MYHIKKLTFEILPDAYDSWLGGGGDWYEFRSDGGGEL